MSFGRLLTAMVTVFDAYGEIDFDRQTRVIEHLIQSGSEGIIVCGTTGESPTLTRREKLKLIEHTLRITAGRVKVIAGTGCNNTRESVELTKEAEELQSDGIMLVTPYYNKPNQEGLYRHFSTIAEQTALPIMLYNVPGRTSCNLAPETVCKLAEMPNIQMVKDACEDIGQMTHLIKNTADDFLVYSGDDGFTLPTLALGGHGVVSVASHVIGKEMRQMIDHYVAGRVKQAAVLHQQLYASMKALFAAPSPAPVKNVLQTLGLCTEHVRLPLVPLTEEEQAHVLSFFSTEEHKLEQV